MNLKTIGLTALGIGTITGGYFLWKYKMTPGDEENGGGGGETTPTTIKPEDYLAIEWRNPDGTVIESVTMEEVFNWISAREGLDFYSLYLPEAIDPYYIGTLNGFPPTATYGFLIAAVPPGTNNLEGNWDGSFEVGTEFMEYVDSQIRDLFNPDTDVGGTSLKIHIRPFSRHRRLFR